MNVDKYLKALDACPRDFVDDDNFGERVKIPRITAELGVYDNWPIFLKADYDTVIRDLQGNGFRMHGEERGDPVQSMHAALLYTRGQVTLIVRNRLSGGCVPSWDYPFRNHSKRIEARKHRERQKRKFNMAIDLHFAYPGKNMGTRRFRSGGWQGSMVSVIKKIVQYAKENEIPFCFPESRGTHHYSDFSRNVYYP